MDYNCVSLHRLLNGRNTMAETPTVLSQSSGGVMIIGDHQTIPK